MLDKIGKGILILVLTAAVLLGAYLGYSRYFMELQSRTVELCVDLNDVKKIAAYERQPVGPILKEIYKMGIPSIGVFEETLPDAAALGELVYIKGSGIYRLGEVNKRLTALTNKGLIKPGQTYIYIPCEKIRKRVNKHLGLMVDKQNIKYLGKDVFEVNEAEEELREIGLGISEVQQEFLEKIGFNLVPRVWNDQRYHLGNIGPKIETLADFDIIVFDGEEIVGYKDYIKDLAQALKKNKIKYGYIEIVKQDGDAYLRKLMDRDVIRVHSVPKNELKKLHKDEVVKRFVRAAKERKVSFIYLRPFLPPQVDAYPVAFNLDYFKNVKVELERAGFVIGKAEKVAPIHIKDWQLLLLGAGVIIAGLFLFNYFIKLHIIVMYAMFFMAMAILYLLGLKAAPVTLQKGLALLTTIIFPALAVISSFSRKAKPFSVVWESAFIVLNIVAEAFVGVFILTGLLADHRFMLGVETFRGVKIALIAPILLVALYFALKQKDEGSFKDRLTYFLGTRVSIASIVTGLFILAALAIFVARSGNFVLPVPGIEKLFRNFLETLLFIRPRSKEFLIGYPLLFLSAALYLKDRRTWLWILAPLGTIAPISILNTFSHIHTPLMISMIRTFNGLVLGVIIGLLVAFIANKLLKTQEW